MLAELRRQVRFSVRESAGGALQGPLLALLRRPGFALDPRSGCRAGMFAIHVHGSLAGKVSAAAFRCAAAVELEVEASFVLDRLADEDEPNPSCGSPGRELALALALLQCGNCAACRTARSTRDPAHAIDAVLRLHECCLAACHGQFLDAAFEDRESVTLDEALDMTCLKAGSVGRLVGGFAARVATTDVTAVALTERLGYHVFSFMQLADDIADACRPSGGPDDLVRGKKTVPVVTFLNGRAPHQDVCTMSDESRWRAYRASDAGFHGAILAEVFLNRARQDLVELANLGAHVDELETFIDSLSSAHVRTIALLGEPRSLVRPAASGNHRLCRGNSVADRDVLSVDAEPRGVERSSRAS